MVGLWVGMCVIFTLFVVRLSNPSIMKMFSFCEKNVYINRKYLKRRFVSFIFSALKIEMLSCLLGTLFYRSQPWRRKVCVLITSHRSQQVTSPSVLFQLSHSPTISLGACSAKKGLAVWRGVAQRTLRNTGHRAKEVPRGKKGLPISYEFSPPCPGDLRARDLGMCIPR